MLLHPDVQKKAQAEIDAVVGPDRLPSFDDREHLPYVDAVCKELLRWHSVTPTGECSTCRMAPLVFTGITQAFRTVY